MNNTTQQLEAIQRMMLVPDSTALQDNVRSFWDIQDKVLDAMKNFANGWFERRHVGTHTALEVLAAMFNVGRRDCITLLGSAPTGQSARTICPGISAKTPLRST